MPTLRDIPGAYERANDQITEFARRLGIEREIIVLYVNDTGHFPQNLDELRAWGRTPNKNYPGYTPLNPNGTWNVLRPGDTPGTLGAKDPGFRHVITNNVDQLQQFLDVDPSGNIWGGSWNPAYNQAHAAELAGKTGFQTASENTMRGSAATTFGARQMDANNFVGPAPNGQFVSMVDGTPVYFNSQAEAEQNFNQRTGDSGAPTGAPSAGSAAGAPAPGGAGAGAPPWYDSPTTTGAGGSSGTGLNAGAAAAANAAVLAWLEKRRLEEVSIPELAARTEAEKERLRQADAQRIWREAYDRATLTGTLDGKPTLDATKTMADITGFTGGGGVGKGQAVLDAMTTLRGEAGYKAVYARAAAGDPAAAAQLRQMEAARIAQVAGVSAEQAAAAVTEMRNLTARGGGAASSVDAVESILNRVAPGQATLARETEQNRTLIATLGLLANLRGPENAFAYANTLANVPASIRSQIEASMARLPVAPRNPAAQGVFGDLATGQAPQPVAPAAPAQPGAVAAPIGQQPQPLPPNVAGGGQVAQTFAGQAVTPNAQAFTPGAVQQDPGYASGIGGTGPAPVAGVPGGFAPSIPPAYGPRNAGAPTPFYQTSPTDWNASNVYARKLLLAGREDAGEDKEAILDEYRRRLPTAVGPRSGRLRAA